MYNKPKVLWKMNEIFDTNRLYRCPKLTVTVFKALSIFKHFLFITELSVINLGFAQIILVA